ncbi:MAG: agmatine deiminase family protein [Anaerolineae bacterium]|nr:agmatine deiminase family protein [Anaerolineae bacterium]
MRTPIRFDYVPYPLWRRRLPAPINAIAPTLLRAFYPVSYEAQPPQTADELAGFLQRWKLLPGSITAADARHVLDADETQVETAPLDAQPAPSNEAIRLPAQWEPMERILLAFPVLYPPLWYSHAQMIEAITPVAEVTVLIPASGWARAISYYLRARGLAQMERVHFMHLPTDDIWIRDFGPFVGYADGGQRAAVDATFAPLDHYPQTQDDAAAQRWAAQAGIPVRRFDFETEGGNYWSDGAGTLLVSDEMLARYPELDRSAIEARLHEAFVFDKLIVLPRLLGEETGHVDLICKLADAQTVLVSQPNGTHNDSRLRQAVELLRTETNARDQRYRVIELPFPPLYRNWGIFPIWRSYTNSLTVNGRVLVPVFGLAEDVQALDIYRAAMPGFDIIPIDCRVAANGGGGVHCLTKEIPSAQPK